MGKDKIEQIRTYKTFNYFDIEENLFVRKWTNKVVKISNIPNGRKLIKINNTKIDLTSWSNSERWFSGDKRIVISESNFDKTEIFWLSNKFNINLDFKKENCKKQEMIIKKTDDQNFVILIFSLTDFERKSYEELYIQGIWQSNLPNNIIQKFYP